MSVTIYCKFPFWWYLLHDSKSELETWLIDTESQEETLKKNWRNEGTGKWFYANLWKQNKCDYWIYNH